MNPTSILNNIDLGPRLNGDTASEWEVIRRDALKSFEAKGFPTRKDEDWRYLNLISLMNEPFQDPTITEVDSIDRWTLSDKTTNRIVFVNGKYSEKHSKVIDEENGLVIGRFNKAKVFSQNLVSKHFAQGVPANRNGFASLNTALADDGLFIHVPAGLKVKHPVEVIHIASNDKAERTMHHLRQMIVLEKGASVTVFETYANQSEQDKTFVNIVNEFVIAENANLEYYKIQNENEQAAQINQTEVQQARDSVFFSTILTSGGALVRNDLNARINDSNCETHFNGLYLGENKSVIDNHTIVDHKYPHTFSSELYKGIMTDSSKAVFNGRIFVREDAQKTNAYQTNRNVLLTEEASVNTKPQLEIWADDVRCSHGATTGQLDKNAIFYLRSRGLSKDDARKFLLKAFTAEVIDTIKDEQIAEHFDQVLQEKLKFA